MTGSNSGRWPSEWSVELVRRRDLCRTPFGPKQFRLGSTRTEVVVLEGQRTNPIAREGENRIAHRWGNPSKSFFADPNNRFVRRADKMDSYFRHFRRSQQGIVVKIALHDAPFLEGDFLAEYRRKPHHHLHLDLPFRGERIHQERPGVHRYVEPFHPNLAFLADGHSGDDRANRDLFDARPPAIPDGDSHARSLG